VVVVAGVRGSAGADAITEVPLPGHGVGGVIRKDHRLAEARLWKSWVYRLGSSSYTFRQLY